MWLLYTLAAAGLWGVGQVLTKKGLANISPLWNNIISYGFMLITMLPLVLWGGADFSRAIAILPVTIVMATTYLSFYYVISKGEIALTGTIWSAYPLATVILASLFLGETTSGLQKMGITGTLTGAVLIAWPAGRKFELQSWVWWGTAGAIMVGSADFLMKLVMRGVDVYTYILSQVLATGIALLGSWFIDKTGQKVTRLSVRSWLPTLAGVGMMQMGMLSFIIAMSLGQASLVGPISGIYQAITGLLAMVWLKEKVNLRQLVGIGLAVSGVLILAV